MQNLMNSLFKSLGRPKQEDTEKPNMYRNRVLAELSPVTPVDDTLTRLRVIQKASKSRDSRPQKHWQDNRSKWFTR